MEIRVLTARDVHAALPMGEAIEAMRDAFGALADGSAIVPLRTPVPVREVQGVTMVMPGALAEIGLGTKIVSVFPRNTQRGLPAVHGVVLMLDPKTGQPRALLEGASLTNIRTGAASGLATDLLAREDATTVAVIGSGVQARTQLEAVCCVRDVRDVRVYSPTADHARRYADEVSSARWCPAPVHVATSAREAVAGADVICAATDATTPVFSADDVASGSHVNGVGSFTPEMRELDPALLAGARTVVDQRSAVMAEAGEIIAAVAQGFVTEAGLVELGDVVRGRAPPRQSEDEITVFKSVGLAAQDVAAGARALRNADRRQLGSILAL